MLRKVVSFMHISLDGYTADENGSMDWILVDEEMFNFAADRTKEADTAIYGRVTYEIMQSYWPTAAEQPHPSRHDIEHSHWYNHVEKVVVSKSMKGAEIAHTTIISENLPEQIRDLQRQKGKDIILFGSPSVTHALMDENLIDDYWLFLNPILLGRGNSLFKDLKQRLPLKLQTSYLLKSGVVALHYKKNQ